jgi:hypothetical protein
MKGKVLQVKLSDIVLDDSIYPRSSVNAFNVARLVAAAKTGAKFPPLIVEAGSFRLVDGRHRYGAYSELQIESVEAVAKSYSSEADLFADAVRYNVSHGLALDQYSINNAIIRLGQMGLSKEAIGEIVRLPVDRLEKIEKGFGISTVDGKPIAVKGGLKHFAGQVLTPQQVATNRHYGGMKAGFYINQIASLLENNMFPRTPTFATAMDKLTSLWAKVRPQP